MQIQSTPGMAASTSTQDSVPVNGKDAAQTSKVQAASTAKPPAETAQAEKGKTPLETLKESIQQLNDAVKKNQPQLQFSVDEETDIHVVKLIDNDSGKIVRQFPSKEAIELAKSIDQFTGMLLKAKS